MTVKNKIRFIVYALALSVVLEVWIREMHKHKAVKEERVAFIKVDWEKTWISKNDLALFQLRKETRDSRFPDRNHVLGQNRRFSNLRLL